MIGIYAFNGRTHFEAIHNVALFNETENKVVRANAKIHILKQFTTVLKMLIRLTRLYVLMQRYTF